MSDFAEKIFAELKHLSEEQQKVVYDFMCGRKIADDVADGGRSHDKFSRRFFSVLCYFIEFLKFIIPPKHYSKLVTDSFEVVSGYFISSNLVELRPDVAVRFMLKSGVPGLFLFEHKSYYDRFALHQLFNYSHAYWFSESCGDSFRSLGCAFPILFFHGPDNWRPSNNFSMCFFDALVDDEFYGEFIPPFRYVLCNLNTVNIDDLSGFSVEFRCAMTLLKYSHNDFLFGFKRSVDFLEAHAREHGLDKCVKDFINMMFSYVSSSPDIDAISVDREISRTDNAELREMLVTLRDSLLEKGRAEGEQIGLKKGREEGREEGEHKRAIAIAKKMLDRGDTHEDIAYITGLPVEEIERL